MVNYSKYRAVNVIGVQVVGKIELPASAPKTKDRKREAFNNKGLCCYCAGSLDGIKTIEHIVPLSLGGNNKIENKTSCCKHCNNMRGNLTLSEFEKIVNERIKPINPEMAEVMIVNINSLRKYIRSMGARLLSSSIPQIKKWGIIKIVSQKQTSPTKKPSR